MDNRVDPTLIKLCFILPHFRAGGLEQLILNLLKNINRKEFSLNLILLNKDGQLLNQIPDDVQVCHLNNLRTSMAMPALISTLNKLNPDLVYTGTNATNLMALLARKGTNSKFRLIISEHTPLSLLLNESKWLSLRIMLMRWLYRYSDLFVAPVSEICLEHKKKLKLPDLQTAVLNNPVLPELLLTHSDRPALMQGKNGHIYIAVGRLAAEKQFDFMIHCFAKLNSEYPNTHLIILGEGTERVKLNSLIKAYGLEASIHLPGYVVDPHEYYRHSIALLSCSRREGFGNVLVEAMNQGLPVISTDCPFGPKNILQDGRVGLLIKLGDQEAFIAAMKQIMTDEILHARLSNSGRTAVQMYKIPCATQQFETICKQLTHAS